MKETTLLGCSYSGFQDAEAERVRKARFFQRGSDAVMLTQEKCASPLLSKLTNGGTSINLNF